MGLVRELWRGDVPLVVTYWLFGVVVGICFAIVFAVIEYQGSGLEAGLGPILILGLIFCYFVYTCFINVAVWRSANKYPGPRRWAILAKIMVLVSWSMLIREAWQIYSLTPS